MLADPSTTKENVNSVSGQIWPKSYKKVNIYFIFGDVTITCMLENYSPSLSLMEDNVPQ